jgi:hypothetical protein
VRQAGTPANLAHSHPTLLHGVDRSAHAHGRAGCHAGDVGHPVRVAHRDAPAAGQPEPVAAVRDAVGVGRAVLVGDHGRLHDGDPGDRRDGGKCIRLHESTSAHRCARLRRTEPTRAQ